MYFNFLLEVVFYHFYDNHIIYLDFYVYFEFSFLMSNSFVKRHNLADGNGTVQEL